MSTQEKNAERWEAAVRAAQTNGASAATAAQDRLPAGVVSSHQMAETDLPRVLAVLTAFRAAARGAGLPAAVLAAIASRESRCGGVLTDGWDAGGFAFGILQVDRRHHQIMGTPDPASEAHLAQAAGIVCDYLDQVVQKHPDWTDANRLKGAVVAYNSGVRNVQTVEGINRGTTGNDYGDDVMARAQYYLTVLG